MREVCNIFLLKFKNKRQFLTFCIFSPTKAIPPILTISLYVEFYQLNVIQWFYILDEIYVIKTNNFKFNIMSVRDF